jgi:hypothetical protein
VDFDAARIVAEHDGMPSHAWPSTALLSVVLPACSSSPWREREWGSKFRRDVAATSAAARLAERGFDIDNLIRRGMERYFIVAVATEACIAASALSRDEYVPEVPAMLGRWLQHEVESDSDDVDALFDAAMSGGSESPIVRRVSHFLQEGASRPAEILCWAVGPAARWDATGHAAPLQATTRDQWILDRFLQTYLDDWDTASLHSEYRWLKGECAPPVGGDSMAERVVDEDRLASVIADRAALSRHEHDASPYMLLEVEVIRLLQEGLLENAVLMLKGALHSNPTSKRLLSHLAFCRIPREPDRAALDLEAVAQTSPDRLLAAANVALAHTAAGRLEDAATWLREAESVTHLGLSSEYFLWDLRANPAKLVAVQDVVEHLRAQFPGET